MRKVVSLFTLIALGAALLVPVAALAKGPPEGKGSSATPPGLQKKAEKAVEVDTSESSDSDAKQVDKAEKTERKVERKADAAVGEVARVQERAQVRSAEESGTPDHDGDGVAEGKQTGIANALSRIMLNIERAEARVESGQQSRVPPGLLRVMSKFLAWLGIDPGTEITPPGPGDGSSEETSTVLPDGGSDEETSALDPI